MGNKLNNTNMLRCRVFDVRDPFEIADSLELVFSNGGQSLDNPVNSLSLYIYGTLTSSHKSGKK